jgi:two-component system NarL family response regulator
MIVDDHMVVREGVESVLGRCPEFLVTGSANGGAEALAMLSTSLPDVVLLDLRMPDMDGVAVLQQLKERAPQLTVVMLSGHAGDSAIRKCLANGASGYVMKTATAVQLREALLAAATGRGAGPSAEIEARLASSAHHPTLSERELEVLVLAGRGRSNKIIADALGLSENTVKNHIKSILKKLDVDDRTSAVTVAFKRGMLDL